MESAVRQTDGGRRIRHEFMENRNQQEPVLPGPDGEKPHPSFIDAFAGANDLLPRQKAVFALFALLSLAAHVMDAASQARDGGAAFIRDQRLEIFLYTVVTLSGLALMLGLYRAAALAVEKGDFSARDFLSAIPLMSAKFIVFSPVIIAAAAIGTVLLLLQPAIGALAGIPLAMLLAVVLFIMSFYLVASGLRPGMKWRESLSAAFAFMKYGTYFGFALLLFMYAVPAQLVAGIWEKMWPYRDASPQLFWAATLLLSLLAAYINFAGTAAQVLYLGPRIREFLRPAAEAVDGRAQGDGPGQAGPLQ